MFGSSGTGQSVHVVFPGNGLSIGEIYFLFSLGMGFIAVAWVNWATGRKVCLSFL